MRRREFIALFGGVAVAWSHTARAQKPGRVRLVGVLFGGADDLEGQARVALLRQGFSQLGWIEGGNIHVDYRWVGGDAARAKADAAELVSQKPDVIIANTTLSLAAVRNETSTIPIVFVMSEIQLPKVSSPAWRTQVATLQDLPASSSGSVRSGWS
jgi:putative ABC transport system substrate-binding protein